jgi:hypothetical protein
MNKLIRRDGMSSNYWPAAPYPPWEHTFAGDRGVTSVSTGARRRPAVEKCRQHPSLVHVRFQQIRPLGRSTHDPVDSRKIAR